MKFAEYQDLLPSEMLETVRNIHAELLAMGFTEEIKEAKSGIKVRLYAAGIAAYEDCLAVLPDSMKAELKKATDCKKTERADLHAHLPRRIYLHAGR